MPDTAARAPDPIFVVGMHRSGTSALAGSLEAAGLFLGEVVTEGRFNAKGSRENRRVMKLNEAVLQANGGTWFDPPEAAAWSEAHRLERDAILEAYVPAPVWGLKDPRFLWTLPGWVEAVPRIRMIGSFRHPWAVVASLRRRPHELGSDEALLELWRRYNARLLTLWDDAPFPLLDFGADDAAYLGSLRRAVAMLGLDVAEATRFFAAELRQSQAEARQDPVPAAVQDVHDALKHRALTAADV